MERELSIFEKRRWCWKSWPQRKRVSPKYLNKWKSVLLRASYGWGGECFGSCVKIVSREEMQGTPAVFIESSIRVWAQCGEVIVGYASIPFFSGAVKCEGRKVISCNSK